MSFEPILQRMLEGCSGALGIALMGSDGIPIEQLRTDPAFAEQVGAAGVEFGRILEEMRKASDALGGGALEETLVRLTRFSLLLRIVDDDTFLVVALGPDANSGLVRYRVRRQLRELRDLL